MDDAEVQCGAAGWRVQWPFDPSDWTKQQMTFVLFGSPDS